MVVGVAQFEIFLPYAHSLKEKRQALRKVQERVFSKFKLSVNEVDHQDLWQRAGLGFAVVGNDEKHIDSLITRTMNFIVSLGLGEVHGEFRDMVHYE